jgi:hypothetical protein
MHQLDCVAVRQRGVLQLWPPHDLAVQLDYDRAGVKAQMP